MNDLELSRRNGQAVQQALREFSDKLEAQKLVIDGLLSTIRSMSERMNSLESMVIKQKVSSFGTGPSVK